MAKTARDFGVGWECAMGSVRRHGEPLVEDPGRLDGVVAIGIDEHKMLCAIGQHHTEYVTCSVDVHGGRLLDVVRGRNADDVAFWLSQAERCWLQAIHTVAIDPHRGDPDGEVAVAILAKEPLRGMYAARSLQAARWNLVEFYQCAADAEVPELTRLARTVADRETEIRNYHVTGISNGPTEAQNLIA